MLSYEKWVAPLLLIFSTMLKIGSIITLYSVYAHSTIALDVKMKDSLIKSSFINAHSFKQ